MLQHHMQSKVRNIKKNMICQIEQYKVDSLFGGLLYRYDSATRHYD